MIQARVFVRSSTESVEADGEEAGEADDTDITMQLQITDMAITDGATAKPSQADALYGKGSTTS